MGAVTQQHGRISQIDSFTSVLLYVLGATQKCNGTKQTKQKV